LSLEKENLLKKDLGLIAAISIVIGVVIGSGVFFKPSIVLSTTGSPAWAITAWIVGGIITLAAGLTIAELAASIPKTGGIYVYLEEIYGEIWGFLYGWVQVLIYSPGSIAALAIIFATQASYFINLSDFEQKLLAVCMIVILLAANIIGTRYGGFISTITTIGKLLPIFAIIIIGLLKPGQGNFHSSIPVPNSLFTGFGAALMATLWAYDGWINISYVAGEMKNPKRNLPLAIIIGLGIVMAAYVLINIAVIKTLPLAEIAHSKTPATDAAQYLFGGRASAIIAAGILISIFGTLNAHILTDPRIPFAMAERKMFPFAEFFSMVHPKFATPIYAMVLTSLISILYVFSGTFDTLTDMAVFSVWLFFIAALYGVFLHRKKYPEVERPYTVPLFPLIPAFALLGGLYILINNLVTNPIFSLYSIGITILGIPVYKYLSK